MAVIAKWAAVLMVALVGCERMPWDEPPVYVTARILNMREDASKQGKVVARLQRGQELTVVDRKEPWIQVRAGERGTGWVHGGYVGTADAARQAYRADLKKQNRRTIPPRPRPEQVTTAHDDGTTLGLSADDLLRGIEPTLQLQELEPIDGDGRTRGVSDDDHIVVEFQGDLDDVTRAMMMVSVEDLDEEALRRNATAALRFVKNAIPNWKRDVEWLSNRLVAMSLVDVGRGEIPAGKLRVALDYVKPLGAVRFTIERQ